MHPPDAEGLPTSGTDTVIPHAVATRPHSTRDENRSPLCDSGGAGGSPPDRPHPLWRLEELKPQNKDGKEVVKPEPGPAGHTDDTPGTEQRCRGGRDGVLAGLA